MSQKTEIHFNDRSLVQQTLGGDRHAFSIIIKNTEGLVAQIIFKMISFAPDRKDLAQDVYLKAYKNLPGFKFQSKLSTWIGQITFNTCLHYIEKKKLVLLEESETDDEPGDETSIKRTSPDYLENETELLFYGKELTAILSIEIEKLSPIYKTLITLFHHEELSYSEITQITSLPEGTVKNYLFRARRILKDNLLLKYKREDL